MKTQEFKDQIFLALELASKKVCAYFSPPGISHRCDCKFGVTEETFGARSERGNGCPEIHVAMKLIQAMTTEEFRELSARAKLLLVWLEDDE